MRSSSKHGEGLTTQLFNRELWRLRLPELRQQFEKAEPFPHVVLDDFIDKETALAAYRDFPTPDSINWSEYRHFNSRKLGQNKRHLIPEVHRKIIDEFNSEPFLDFVRSLTGMPSLIGDPALEGSGLHQTPRNGFLNIHCDSTSHIRNPYWKRRVNLLLYLNPDWKKEYGGQLELWDSQMQSCRKRILPQINRCVIFRTDRNTYHGHPGPLACPEAATRKSIILYYYTEEKQKPIAWSTEYKARPQDSRLGAFLISLDSMLLGRYDMLRRRLGIGDDYASKLVRFFR